MTYRIIIICFLIQVYLKTFSYPCPSFSFSYIDKGSIIIMEDDFIIEWSYSKDCEEVLESSDQKFVIQLETVFEEVIYSDTISGRKLRIDKESLNVFGEYLIFKIRELDSDNFKSIGIGIKSSMEVPIDKYDLLNYYLLNGFFLNATATISDLGLSDILPKFKEQYKLIFPANYQKDKDFFNCYYSKSINDLIQMPYVDGLDDFIKMLNKKTKHEYLKGEPFLIQLIINPENEIMNIDVSPPNNKLKIVEELIDYLSFDNQYDEFGRVTMKIGRSPNSRKYLIENRRALINPNSVEFRKSYSYHGAIH